MNRRSKSTLLAVLAMFAIPAMTACVLQPGPSEPTDRTDPDTVETEPAETEETEPAETEPVETDPAGAEASFAGSRDLFDTLEADFQACVETDEQPIPEGLDAIEPKLAGAVYAFCTFEDGRKIVGVLLADANAKMADTQLSSPKDIEDFKREATVTSLTIGGNWLITSPDDDLVAELADLFGGEIY